MSRRVRLHRRAPRRMTAPRQLSRDQHIGPHAACRSSRPPPGCSLGKVTSRPASRTSLVPLASLRPRSITTSAARKSCSRSPCAPRCTSSASTSSGCARTPSPAPCQRCGPCCAPGGSTGCTPGRGPIGVALLGGFDGPGAPASPGVGGTPPRAGLRLHSCAAQHPQYPPGARIARRTFAQHPAVDRRHCSPLRPRRSTAPSTRWAATTSWRPRRTCASSSSNRCASDRRRSATINR